MNIQEIYSVYKKYPVVTTDSRQCAPGSIFFALKGERFDGNQYILQALEQGCVLAVGDDPSLPDHPQIAKVGDSLSCLQQLANYHRHRLTIPVIGITGTNGKTTTKELVAATLSSKYKVLFTQGNLNNHIGVPLTLLKITNTHEIAVIEMGANHPGEIAELCAIAEPDYGLITNVGRAHLEGFGSFEGVIRTKSELYDFLRARGGKAFVNRDNPILMDKAAGLDAVYYDVNPTVPVCPSNLTGDYNRENILAAVAIASYFGVGDEEIRHSIGEYQPTNNRSQQKQTERNLLIVDAYNANPTSMQAALDNFKQMNVRPKMVILGDMKELGDYSAEEHQKIVDYLQAAGFERVVLCGQNFIQCTPDQEGWQVFPRTGELLDYLKENPISNYHILIKGSRSNQLEKTVELL